MANNPLCAIDSFVNDSHLKFFLEQDVVDAVDFLNIQVLRERKGYTVFLPGWVPYAFNDRIMVVEAEKHGVYPVVYSEQRLRRGLWQLQDKWQDVLRKCIAARCYYLKRRGLQIQPKLLLDNGDWLSKNKIAKAFAFVCQLKSWTAKGEVCLRKLADGSGCDEPFSAWCQAVENADAEMLYLLCSLDGGVFRGVPEEQVIFYPDLDYLCDVEIASFLKTEFLRFEITNKPDVVLERV